MAKLPIGGRGGLLQHPHFRKGGLIAGVLLAVVAGFVVYTTRAATPATGLSATYYNNADFTGTSVSRVDPQINFDWGTGSPDPKIASTSYSARWTGQLFAPTTGTYRVNTQSDDGVRVWVDNQLIINSWTSHDPMENSGSISLVEGKKYDLKVEFFQQDAGARLTLGWTGPNIPQTIIPSGYLSTTVPDQSPTPTASVINETFGGATSNFVQSGGTWAVANGTLNLTNPSRTSIANANTAVHKQIVSGDFSLTADGKVLATDDPWNDFSVLFGYKDANNYYFASFNENDDGRTNGIFKVVNGEQTELANFTTKFVPGQNYKVGITRNGAGIVVVVNGATVGTANDSTYSVGQIGFGTRNDSAIFDNLVVNGKSGGVTAPTPTPAASATPVPTATPVATATPAPSTINGYPSDINTGVPQGKAGDTRAKVIDNPRQLPRYTGPCTITTVGVVIEGKLIDCSPLEVKAKNVVIRKSLVLASNAQAITITDDSMNTLIEDTEVDGQGLDNSIGGISLIGRTGYKLVRVNAHGSGDILRIDGWGEVTDSWLHEPLCKQDSCHNDIIQSTNAVHILVNHNRLENPKTQTSCILIKSDLGNISDVTIKNNLFNGGGYTVYWYDVPAKGFTSRQGNGEGIHDNKWMRKVSPGGYWEKGGSFGPWADASNSVPAMYNNTWYDNGQSIF